MVTRVGAVAIVCAWLGPARAGSVLFDNGGSGEGFTQVSPDDYGTYGVLIGQQFDDEYNPVGVANPFTPTYLTGPELYVTTNSTHTSSALLSDYRAWANFLENPPPTPDGLLGDPMHTNLARTVTMPIAITAPNEAKSGFRIATDTAGGVRLDFALTQRLTSNAVAKTSQVDQIYTITNNGTLPAALVFHVVWDADLYYNALNQETDDIVGSVVGLCGVYMNDGDPRWGVGLGAGPLSTVPLAYYYGGKKGEVPGSGPPFMPVNAAINEQYTWINHGMPAAWQNFVVGPGKNAVGESDPAIIADATIGIEWRFTLAVGASETVHVRRYYGSAAVPCFVSTKCGNGVVDSGELCDGADTTTCNGATCTMSLCGDGHMNTLAGELCDSAGSDSATCNGGDCTLPACGDGYFNAAAGEDCDSAGVDSETCNGATCTLAACGDGYLNVAAGEECETGELCDVTTCSYNFRVGGGCAGCGASGLPDASCLVLLALLRRRRRR